MFFFLLICRMSQRCLVETIDRWTIGREDNAREITGRWITGR